MHARQPLPRLWMMTDERQGEGLWAALTRMPRGGGVVFRHYALGGKDRRALFDRVARIAARRGLVLVVADPKGLPVSRASGVHNVRGAYRRGMVRTASAHDVRELRAAEAAGVDLVFVSPIFPTRSHVGARAIGPVRFGLMVRGARVPVIALGGMNARRFQRLRELGAYGWAAIDAWMTPGE